jgi:hypothetical protein
VFASGTRVNTEHPADEAGQDYWHVLDVTLAETAVSTAVGIARNAGLELMMPVRTVTTRVRFEDQTRRPFVPAEGDIHHRDETVAGTGDPWLLLHTVRPGQTWTLAARAGVTIPLGRTEPNPFVLGDLGKPHQHVQLGTGTWDPVGSAMLARRLGAYSLTLHVLVRLALYENEHGYRAGDRLLAGVTADRALFGRWRGSAALDVAREDPERWDGSFDTEEGNLGRTDLRLTAALLRPIGGVGALRLAVSVPLATRVRGAQLDYPLILSVGLSR